MVCGETYRVRVYSYRDTCVHIERRVCIECTGPCLYSVTQGRVCIVCTGPYVHSVYRAVCVHSVQRAVCIVYTGPCVYSVHRDALV